MAQSVVSGMVTDRQTGRPLSHVSIAAEGSDVHTVSNDDGRFTLKVPQLPRYVRVSHIGYKTRREAVGSAGEPLQIQLQANTVALSEVVIAANDPEAILQAAISRIETNYPEQPELTRCFYRETARRGQRFISVAEAVTEMYKSPYAYGPEHDAVAIIKGRRLMSMKARDTLGVKLQGGPVMPLMADVAKNRDYVLCSDNLAYCDLKMLVPATIGDRLQYVIELKPRGAVLYPLLLGKLYIDQKTLAFTRAELALDMRDWRTAAGYMLVRKPAGLRFRPKLLEVTVVFHTDEQGITRLAYQRSEMRFTCDWRRRLFASPFTVVSEMVVTDRLAQGKGTKRPRGRSSFGLRDKFYDKVEYFEDPDFWADYNIIEPTESLEHAIGRLKKRVKNQ